MADTFSGCEIVELGIQIEKNGKDFFSAVSLQAKSEDAKEVFQFLSNEDDKHTEVFQNLFKTACSYSPEGLYPEEYFAYMNSLASSYVFTKKDKGIEAAKEAKSDKEAIDVGISYVKDAILFYEGMKKVVAEKDMEIVEKLVQEEKKHLEELCSLKKRVCGPDAECTC